MSLRLMQEKCGSAYVPSGIQPAPLRPLRGRFGMPLSTWANHAILDRMQQKTDESLGSDEADRAAAPPPPGEMTA